MDAQVGFALSKIPLRHNCAWLYNITTLGNTTAGNLQTYFPGQVADMVRCVGCGSNAVPWEPDAA